MFKHTNMHFPNIRIIIAYLPILLIDLSLLDAFVFCTSILEPNFDLCLS